MLRIILYAVLCAAPLLILLPVWRLDREPDNAITQEQGSDRDPGELLLAA
jgi:hypothetical protein